jgi:hypothetical protein
MTNAPKTIEERLAALDRDIEAQGDYGNTQVPVQETEMSTSLCDRLRVPVASKHAALMCEGANEIERQRDLLRRARIQLNSLCAALDLMPDDVGELLNQLAIADPEKRDG